MLTQEELERRRKFVTASETPAILGLSPWANAGDVFASKVYGTKAVGNDATRAGNLLEPAVLEWANTQIGPLIGGGWRVHGGGVLAATLDEETAGRDVVEAKTSGIVGPGTPHQWGQEGTDEIPEHVLIQVQTQMLVTGAARAFVPALLGGRGFCMFVVDANQELQAIIETNVMAFWHDHVEPQEPPLDRPSLDTLKRMIRVPGKTVTVADELAEAFLMSQVYAKAANDKEEFAKAALIAAISDGEIAKWSGGEFSFKEQSRKECVVKASTFRVLRAKKTKGAVCPATTEMVTVR